MAGELIVSGGSQESRVCSMADFVAAIDHGTTSTRCMVFGHDGREVGRAQHEHRQIMPAPGRVEHDAAEIWQRTQEVVAAALHTCRLGPDDLAAVGAVSYTHLTLPTKRIV